MSLMTTEGSTSDSFLFGRINPVRIMNIYNKEVLPKSFLKSRTIKQVTFRSDQVNNTTRFSRKRNILLTVTISTTGKTAESGGLEFDAFHGPDRAQVFNGRLDVPLQPMPNTPQTPRPFNIPLAFSQPWHFVLPSETRVPQPPSLVLDFRVEDKASNPEYRLDMSGLCRSKTVSFGLGQQCVGSSGKGLTLSVTDRVYASNNIIYRIDGALKDEKLLLAISAAPIGRIMPIEVDPGSGCYININPLVIVMGTADSIGQGAFKFPVPRRQDLVGLEVLAQAAAYDINANNFSHVTSIGVSSTVCGPLGVCQLLMLNGLANTATKAQANIYGLAHVIAFQ